MKILLAVDGSVYSQAALDFLSRFPFGQPPELLITHVCPTDELTGPREDVPAFYWDYVDEYRARGQVLLEEAATQGQAWCSSISTRLLSGSPARAIVDCARDEAADLIVIGARGVGAVKRFLLGSVSDSVSRHAHCSVLVVRPELANQDQSGLRAIFAVDGTDPASHAVSRFASLPLGDQSSVRLISIVNVLQAYHVEHTLKQGPALSNLLSEYQNRLEKAAATLKQATSNVELKLIEVMQGTGPAESNVADRILREADQWHPNLIVVGSTGGTGWERMLLGSVSTRILNHAPCSVWIDRNSPPAA